jgi:hypothetical protein
MRKNHTSPSIGTIKKILFTKTYYLSITNNEKVQISRSEQKKENMQHFKKWNLLTFFYVCVSFLPSFIRIRILDPDTDPGKQFNPDPNPDKDPDPQHCIKRWQNSFGKPHFLHCSHLRSVVDLNTDGSGTSRPSQIWIRIHIWDRIRPFLLEYVQPAQFYYWCKCTYSK